MLYSSCGDFVTTISEQSLKSIYLNYGYKVNTEEFVVIKYYSSLCDKSSFTAPLRIT